MTPLPLPKRLYARAVELQVTAIELCFDGGSDEGSLHIGIRTDRDAIQPNPEELQEFEAQIDDWAWDVYDYSGAGDGSDYGDDITYDLAEGRVSYSEWYMERHDTTYDSELLEVEDSEVEDSEVEDSTQGTADERQEP